MRILVTGGAGYIGSMLIRLLLERGYDVVCLDRFFFGMDSIKDIIDQIKIIKDDIRWFDPKILKNIDAVFDLAALSNDPAGELDPKKTMEINYMGRVRVAKLSKKNGVKKYVLASTCSVYGQHKGICTEETKPNPLTTYAKASMLAEKGTLALADRNFCVTALRQATVYGLSYRMRFDLVVNAMVRALYKYEKVFIGRPGTQWRPLVHVKDTSRAFIMVLEADDELVNGQIFNVGSNEQNYQIFNLAKEITEALNMPFNYEWMETVDTRSYRVSFDKIKRVLNFKPEYTVKDGAREIYNALVNGEINPDDPRWITVKWYKHLIEMREFLKQVEINGRLL